MSRIFLGLSSLALVVLIYACIDGLLIGDYQTAFERYVAAKKSLAAETAGGSQPSVEAVKKEKLLKGVFFDARARTSWHTLVGVGAALLALLVNCLSVTYFIGTGRWCKEVCETYKLNPDYHRRSDALKRRTFPWSVGGIVLLLLIICTGPPCDPLATLSGNAGDWVAPHRYVSIIATLLMAASFLRQVVLIRQHYLVIGEILAEVKRVREEKGLDLEPSAHDPTSA